MMDLFDVAERLEKARWIFARTMPENPHEYTLRKEWQDDEEFIEVVKAIRMHGRKELFKGQEYIYFYVNGYKYWTMGAPLNKTILINRAVAKYHTSYDDIAEEYDSLYDDPEHKKEDEIIKEALSPFIKGRVLDIGCGTGLGARLFQGLYDEYIGIDKSYKMIEVARRKNRHLSNVRFINVSVKDFYMRGFNVIIALYGVFSYLTPGEQMKVIKSLNGERLFLMCYAEGYKAKTGQGDDKYPCIARELLPCNYTVFNKYVLVSTCFIEEAED